MKKKWFTEEQIIKALKEHEAGAKVADIIRRVGISEATFYNWRSKYGGQIRKKGSRKKGSVTSEIHYQTPLPTDFTGLPLWA